MTADIRALPFANARFDLVVSLVAIHNIASQGERADAISRAAAADHPS